MADPKGPEPKGGGAGASARPKSPTLDLKAADVTPKPTEPPAAKPVEAGAGESASGSPESKTPAGPTTSPRPSAGEPAQNAARDPKLDAGSTRDAPKGPSAPATASAKPASAPSAPSPAGAASPSTGAGAPAAAPAKPSSSSVPPTGTAKPAANAAPPPPDRASGGAGVLGAAVAGLLGAAVAIAVVLLFGRDLIGTPAGDASRVEAAERKLDAVGRDVAALREQASAPQPAPDTSAADARIGELAQAVEAAAQRSASLESELKELAGRAPAVQVDTGAVDALGTRIDAIEAKVGEAASAGAVSELGGRIDGVAGRLDGVGASLREALKPLEDKVAALEAELKAKPEGDPAARQIVALGALEQALAQGRPFTNELAAAKAAGGETAALEGLAATGAPTRAALAAELKAIVADLPPLRAGADASLFQRFVASAGSVVKVTPADAPEGGGAAGARARLAVAAEKGDVAAGLAARDGLDEPAKAATDAWAKKAEALRAAEGALAEARSAALARLGSN